MGEIAEMMLDGTLCGGCGAALDGSSPGYPRYCSEDCEPEGFREAVRQTMVTLQAALGVQGAFSANAKRASRQNRERHVIARARKPFACDQCTRLCRTPEGLAQHKKDKHG